MVASAPVAADSLLDDELARLHAALARDDPAAAFDAARTAARLLATRQPLRIVEARFLEEPATGFGLGRPRAPRPFAPGELAIVYLEPSGFGYDRAGARWWYGLGATLALLDDAGVERARAADIGQWTYEAARPVLDAYLSLEFVLPDLSAGDYTLRLEITDLVAAQTISSELPLSIAASNDLLTPLPAAGPAR